MSFKILWELGEVYTAPLNLFLVLLGVAFSKYEYGASWNWRMILLVLIIILFHVAVNIFNNYMDYRHSSDEHDYKQHSNIIGRENLSLKDVKHVFWLFLGAAIVVGTVLVAVTSIWVLVLGVIGFCVGLFYSGGPKPLNSLPIAELITSVASGFFIPLVSTFITSYDTIEFTGIDIRNVFFISLPVVCMMFNNLLANNTCDIEEDIVNGRKTMVYYIGKENAVRLLKGIFLFAYGWLVVLAYVHLIPKLLTIIVLLAVPLWNKLTPYFNKQEKQSTFPIVLKTMSVLMVVYPALFFILSITQIK